MSKKICHMSTVHTSRDIRIFYKECISLAKAGYEVYYIVTNDKEEIEEGVHIIPLAVSKNRFQRIFAKSWTALNKAIKLNADVYHFHDPELILAGLILKIFHKKVIYDVHEDVSAQILLKQWIKTKFLRKIISAFYGCIEKLCVKAFDYVITATPEIAKKFPEKKTKDIRNLPIIGIINTDDIINVNNEIPVAIYAGGLTKIRGIKQLVDSVGLLNGKVILKLYGKWESKSFMNECQSSAGWKYTKYEGLLAQKELYKCMKKADIGMVNFLPAGNHINALPNKPFEYMACGLPIVMSNFKYWNEMFGKCAIFANPEDPHDIADKIKYLVENKNISNRLGNVGKTLIKSEYSWEAEQNKLIEIYNILVGCDS